MIILFCLKRTINKTKQKINFFSGTEMNWNAGIWAKKKQINVAKFSEIYWKFWQRMIHTEYSVRTQNTQIDKQMNI